MSDNTIRPAKGGGIPRAPKRTKGRGWLAKRTRKGLTWRERKLRSRRYCAPQPRVTF